MEYEICKRKRIKVKGEHIYFFSGETFVDSSCPYENRVESMPLLQRIHEICESGELREEVVLPQIRAAANELMK